MKQVPLLVETEWLKEKRRNCPSGTVIFRLIQRDTKKKLGFLDYDMLDKKYAPRENDILETESGRFVVRDVPFYISDAVENARYHTAFIYDVEGYFMQTTKPSEYYAWRFIDE